MIMQNRKEYILIIKQDCIYLFKYIIGKEEVQIRSLNKKVNYI